VLDIVKLECLGLGYHAQLRNSEDRQGRVSENGRRVVAGIRILENCPKVHALSGGTGPVARRHCRNNPFAWLREVLVVLGFWKS